MITIIVIVINYVKGNFLDYKTKMLLNTNFKAFLKDSYGFFNHKYINYNYNYFILIFNLLLKI